MPHMILKINYRYMYIYEEHGDKHFPLKAKTKALLGLGSPRNSK